MYGENNNAAHLSKLAVVALDVGDGKKGGVNASLYVFFFLQPEGLGQNVGALLAVDDSNAGGRGCRGVSANVAQRLVLGQQLAYPWLHERVCAAVLRLLLDPSELYKIGENNREMGQLLEQLQSSERLCQQTNNQKIIIIACLFTLHSSYPKQ